MVKLVEPKSKSQTFKSRITELSTYSIPLELIPAELLLSRDWLSLNLKIMDRARREYDMDNLVINTQNTHFLYRGGGEEWIIAFVPSGHEGNYGITLKNIISQLHIPLIERPSAKDSHLPLLDYMNELDFSIHSSFPFGWDDIVPIYSEIHFLNGDGVNHEFSGIGNYFYCILPGRKYVDQKIFRFLTGEKFNV